MKKIILAFAGLALVLSSCEDFLVKEPPTQISDDKALETYQGILDATHNNTSTIGWYASSFPLTFDIMCGNGLTREMGTGFGTSIQSWDFTPTSELGLWGSAYYHILCCNRVLAAIDKNEFERDNTVTQADINNLKAVNLTLRAMAYFDMVRVYGQSYNYIVEKGITGDAALGVPIVTVDDLSARPSRATVAEVYDFIISELKTAESLMDPNYQCQCPGLTDVRATVSLPVLHALMARVYLEHRDYQLAVDYATKVINCGQFKLQSGNNFMAMWGASVAPSNSEIIFEFYIDLSEGSSNSNVGEYLSPLEYGDIRLSQDLLDLYDKDDIRYSKLTMTVNDSKKNPTGTYRWCAKYPGKEGYLPCNNIPIIRLSEMYLIRAEAATRGNLTDQKAIDDLNQVALARGAKAYGNATLDNILEERRKEFVFEGHIYFDLKRFQKGLTRNDYTLTSNQNVEFPSWRWAFPVPQHDVINNKNIVQNPGYSK